MGFINVGPGPITATSNAAATVVSPIQGDAQSLPFSMIIFFNVSGLAGTSPTLQVILEAFDDASQNFVQWGTAFTAVAANGMQCYVVGSTGVGAAVGGVTATVNLPVPNKWRIRTVAGGTITNVVFTLSVYTVPIQV
jgi:hypothetical protein